MSKYLAAALMAAPLFSFAQDLTSSTPMETTTSAPMFAPTPAPEPAVAPAAAPAVAPATIPVCAVDKVLASCNKFAKHAKWKTKIEKKHGCTCPAIAKKVKVEGEKKVHAVKKHVKAEVAPKVEKTEAAPVAEEKAGE